MKAETSDLDSEVLTENGATQRLPPMSGFSGGLVVTSWTEESHPSDDSSRVPPRLLAMIIPLISHP